MIKILLAGLFLYGIQYFFVSALVVYGICNNGCHNPPLKLWKEFAINHNV